MNPIPLLLGGIIQITLGYFCSDRAIQASGVVLVWIAISVIWDEMTK